MMPSTDATARLPASDPLDAAPATPASAVVVVVDAASSDDLVERIRALLADPENRYPEAAEVTRALGVSSRTLRRKLARRGTSFLALRDAARRTRALAMLEGSRLTVERIARELGYSEAAGFVRAFHRWMGQSPGSYRRRMAR